MTTMRITPTGEKERAQALVDLGFDPTQALLMATTQREGEHVDLNLVRRLLDAGCDHDLALRIVL